MGIQFNYATSIISITAPQTDISMQELSNAISDEEATPWGMNYPASDTPGIAEIAGKFDKSGGAGTTFSEIIVDLYSPWQVQFWQGSGVTKTAGGSLLGGLGGIPVKATGAAGDITLVSQPVDGTLIVEGVAGLTEEEHDAVMDISFTDKSIYINTELEQNGDGRSGSPFNSFTSAVDFSEISGIRRLVLLADADVDRQLKNFEIRGVGMQVLNFNGQNMDRSQLENLKLTGEQLGEVHCREVILLPGVSGLNGVYKESGLAGGTIYTADNSVVTISASSIFTSTHTPTVIDLGAAHTNTILNLRRIAGFVGLKNVNHANKLVSAQFDGGHLNSDVSNTDGVIGVAGLPQSAVVGIDSGSTFILDGLLPSAESIKEAVLDGIIGTRPGGSLGALITDIASDTNATEVSVAAILTRTQEILQGVVGTLDIVDNGDGTETVKVFAEGEIDPDNATPIFTMTVSNVGLRRIRN